MTDKYDPFATHIPKGMTREEADEEEQKLLRQQLEDDLLRDTESFREKIRRNSQTD